MFFFTWSLDATIDFFFGGADGIIPILMIFFKESVSLLFGQRVSFFARSFRFFGY
jgi:hypothetical protein